MEKEILIVKNTSEEGPGLLEVLLNELGIGYQVADLQKNDSFPPVKNYGAIVVLGGPDSANDQNDKIENELLRIREIIEGNIPFLGICLGLQLLIKAAGGQVIRSQPKEVGFIGPDGNHFSLELTYEGKQDPLFSDLEHSFKVFHLHGETVELTKDCTLLAVGNFCRNQIVKVGSNAYGIQCHFELTPEMFEIWINEDADLLELDKEVLRSEFKFIQSEYTQTGRQLFENFIKIAGF